MKDKAFNVRTMLLAILLVGVMAGFAMLLYEFWPHAVLTSASASYNYIGFLTLAVTILLAGGALIAWIGVWLSLRMFDAAEKTKRELRSARAVAEKIVRELEQYNTKYHSLVSGAYGTFRPTGLQLAKATYGLSKQIKDPGMRESFERLAREIEKNAIIGAHLLNLFLAHELREVKSAALALAAQGRPEDRRLIQKRLDLEKKMPEPNSDLIEYLGKILGMIRE